MFKHIISSGTLINISFLLIGLYGPHIAEITYHHLEKVYCLLKKHSKDCFSLVFCIFLGMLVMSFIN